MAAIAVATTVSISGALIVAPQLAKADAISDLMAQIAALQSQIAALQGGGSSGTGTGLNLTTNLGPGSKGAAVTALQTALKTDASVYPEGIVSGFYGSLTTKAVQRFQAKYAIVSSGTPSATGYGAVGPKTRAKLNSVYGGTGGTTGTGTTGTTAVGSGLTVSSVTQPSATLAPQGASRLPFVKVQLSASSDGDVTVKSLTVARQGLGDDAVFTDLALLDDNGMQIGLTKTFNANHTLSFNSPFTVKAGTTRTLTVGGNMAASLAAYAGEVINLAVTAVDAGTSAVSGSLPVAGNGMTINASLTIGAATVQIGTTDPQASSTAKNVGDSNFIFSAVRMTAGSAEDLTVKSIRWEQVGSVGSADIDNVTVVVGGTSYPTTNDGKFYWASFGSSGIMVPKGNSLEIAIKGDFVNGSGRTAQFNIRKAYDIVMTGNLFGYNVTPTGSGGHFSTAEPFFGGYLATVNNGTLLVQKDNTVTATNIPLNTSNVPLGSFLFTARGEAIQITSLPITFTGSTSPNLTGVAIYDKNGNVVAGPKDLAVTGGPTTMTFTDTITVPTGDNVYTLKGKLGTQFNNGDTIGISMTPSGFTARGTVTGNTITPTPSSAVTGNTQTVRSAALSSSIASTPVVQNVVRGVNGFKFATIQYDASNSGEDLRITSQALTDTLTNSAVAGDLTSCFLYDGTTILNDGSNVVNPSAAANTFTFTNGLVVTKGTVKNVDLKCNITSSAVSNGTHSWGFTAAQTAAVTGLTTGNTVTPLQSLQLGQGMTVKVGGSFTITLDTSSPTERYGIANSTGNVLSVFKLHAVNEDLRLDKIQLSFSSSTASTTDIVQFTLWDGATQVGSGVFAGSNVTATTTLSSSVIIPKDGDKLLTVKADLTQVGTSQPGTTGHTIAININGSATTSTVAIGQSSGSSFNSGTSADVNGNGVRLVKSYPTLALLPLPTNTLSNGQQALYRFSVTAPAAGDVGLYKFTFNVSSSTVATSSSFSVYGYSDSAFSVQAYNNNPLNSNPAAVVSSSTMLSMNSKLNGQSGNASTSQIAIYFDPVLKTPTTPNQEAINVPAGTTRYFELRGTITGAIAGDAFIVSLQGDSSAPSRTSTNVYAYTSIYVDQNGTGKFIWSPNSTSTAATTTQDWLNGYELPGLPSTNMQSQTISK